MTTATHTAGPWVIDPHDSRQIYQDGAEGLEGSDAEADANAKLIAASPEMFAALEYIAGFDPVAIAANPVAIRKRAQAAIDKATK